MLPVHQLIHHRAPRRRPLGVGRVIKERSHRSTNSTSMCSTDSVRDRAGFASAGVQRIANPAAGSESEAKRQRLRDLPVAPGNAKRGGPACPRYVPTPLVAPPGQRRHPPKGPQPSCTIPSAACPGQATDLRGTTPMRDTSPPDYDGPVCARPGCGKPLVRRVLPSGKLESSADFRRRTCCSAECRRAVQRAGLGLPSRRSR